MWTWELVSGWLRAPVDEVAALGLDLSRLDRWHVLLADVEPGRWQVRRQVRTLAHVAVADDDGAILDLDVVVAPWNGGTVVELGASGTRFAGRRLRRAPLRRSLRQSLEDLAAMVDHPLEPAPIARHPRGLAPATAAPA